MKKDTIVVALDDSKRTIVAEILQPGATEPESRSIPNEPRHLRRLFDRWMREGPGQAEPSWRERGGKQMRKRRRIVMWAGFLLLAGLLALGGQAPAASLDEVKMKGKLLVGVKADFPPFGYVDSSGKHLGFDVDLARALAKRLFDDENKVELVTVTSGNRIPFLYSEWIDLIIATMTITDERRQVLEFSEPYFLSGSLLLAPKTSPIGGLEHLAGKKVAVIEGAIQDRDLEQVAPKASRVKFARVSEAIQALKGGGVDAFAQDDVLVLTLAKENPDLKVVGKPFIPRPYAIAARKGDVELIKWVNDQLAKMKRDGTYEGLWKKYFGDVEANLLKP